MERCYAIRRSNSSNELTHWKYIKKVRVNGRWRYYYDKESLKADVKNKLDSIYNDPTNMYDVSGSNYDKKLREIANSKEWQDIVRRQDPEYVRKNADGTTTYLIDDYLVKKKHPELDIIDDLGSGRKISLNEINAQTLIAGGKDYIKSAQQVLGIAARVLTEKFKLSQGSYNKQINQTVNTANTTVDTVRAIQTGMQYLSAMQTMNQIYTLTQDKSSR